jgi:serine/threonine-protein kinase
MLTTGSTLKQRYRIETVLGAGGMGAVYRARDLATDGAVVAIKEMVVRYDQPKGLEWSVRQFHKEAHLLASLDHPALIRVLDFFPALGNYYLVMSYVDGQTLEQIVTRVQAPVPVWQVRDWMEQILEGLQYLHTRTPPVLVRDLKPSNLMLDRYGKIWLIDFGIARLWDPQHPTTTFCRGIGTPGYAPLEQFTGQTDERTDIYALGATLYYLVTFRIPPMSVSVMMRDEIVCAPHECNPTVSPRFSAIIMKMMSIAREDRYQNVAEVRAALAAATAADSPTGRSAAPAREADPAHGVGPLQPTHLG